jgi:hypothetical protein
MNREHWYSDAIGERKTKVLAGKSLSFPLGLPKGLIHYPETDVISKLLISNVRRVDVTERCKLSGAGGTLRRREYKTRLPQCFVCVLMESLVLADNPLKESLINK